MREPGLRERALRFLARREYARVELARKLAAHAESARDIDAVLDDLSSRGLLSDARYAEMRVYARSARFGDARLAQEMRAAGVDDTLADEALAGAEDELTRAKEVWQRKYGAGGIPSDATGRARQTNFLARRGFSGETIRRILRGSLDDD